MSLYDDLFLTRTFYSKSLAYLVLPSMYSVANLRAKVSASSSVSNDPAGSIVWAIVILAVHLAGWSLEGLAASVEVDPV